MKYEIKIGEFSGPLDLLLHLIKTSNMDIFDIKIDEITQQYLDYIHKMETLNLDVASEYLVMAAELIEIKSKTLLPKEEIEEDTYEEDARSKLVERLLEYKLYKEVSTSFKELEEERKEVYTKIGENLKEYTEENTVIDFDLDMLTQALAKFLQRKEDEKPRETTVTEKEYSVKERSIEIRNLLSKKKKAKFEELFTSYQRNYVVVTFLSILMMCKKGEVILEQGSNFSDIYLSLKEK